MKSLLVGLLLIPAVASADSRTVAVRDDASPELTTTTTPATATPGTAYVALGVSTGAGAGFDWIYGGTAVDVGFRTSDTGWFHAKLGMRGRMGYGTTNDITIISPTGGIGEAVIGLDTRRCHDPAVCVVAGVDAGARFGNSATGAIVAPHLALDLGGDHLRFRPGIEAPMVWGGRSPDSEVPGFIPGFGLGVTLAAAYQW